MRMKLPITGTVKEVSPYIIGDNDDPIRPVSVDLGNVSWTLIGVDLESEEMEIEITPSIDDHYDTGTVDGEGDPIFAIRKATAMDKVQAVEYALDRSLGRMSKQALYDLSKSPRLKNPFKKVA